MVGALILNTNGELISEGFHKLYGQAHAEQAAIQAAIKQGRKEELKGSSIYVSLEPCAHHGKTPACTDLIIQHKIKRVIYASPDPNPLVSSKGLAKLQSHRIEILGPENLDPDLVKRARKLNRAFYKHLDGASWVTAKIALNADASMLAPARSISTAKSQQDVHRLRASHQVLISAYGTVITDNPQLNVRYSAEELGLSQIIEPIKVIMTDSRDFTELEKASLNIFQGPRPARIVKAMSPKDLIKELRQEGLSKIMLEAGPRLQQSFLEAGLVDELIIYQALEKVQPNLFRHQQEELSLEAIASKLSKIYAAKEISYELIKDTGREDLKLSLFFS